MVELVRPGDCQELLPPTRGNERDVEPKDEGERDEGEKGVEISHNALEKPEKKQVPTCSIEFAVTFSAQDSSPLCRLLQG